MTTYAATGFHEGEEVCAVHSTSPRDHVTRNALSTLATIEDAMRLRLLKLLVTYSHYRIIAF